MAQDARPPSDPNHVRNQSLSSTPASPHTGQAAPDTPAASRAHPSTTPDPPRTPSRPLPGSTDAWWTRPIPVSTDPAPDPAPDQPVIQTSPAVDGVGHAEGTGTKPSDGAEPLSRRIPQQMLTAQGKRWVWTVLAAAAGVPLLAAMAVATLRHDMPGPAQATGQLNRPDQAAASRATRTPLTVTPSAPTPRPSGQPADLAAVPTRSAATDLRRTGVTVPGTINGAWGWTDSRGRSLVATVTETTSRNHEGAPTIVSLRVYYVTGLDDKPLVRRALRDAGLRCSNRGPVMTEFTPAGFGIRDLDGNGSPEVMVGWTARCAQATASSRVRVAVMSGSKLYVVRGTGLGTGHAAGGTAPSPSPPRGQWPPAVLHAAMASFRSISS